MFHIIDNVKFDSAREKDITIEFHGNHSDYYQVEAITALMNHLGYEEIDLDDNSDSSDLLCWSLFRKRVSRE